MNETTRENLIKALQNNKNVCISIITWLEFLMVERLTSINNCDSLFINTDKNLLLNTKIYGKLQDGATIYCMPIVDENHIRTSNLEHPSVDIRNFQNDWSEEISLI